jgi:hypothetical protein
VNNVDKTRKSCVLTTATSHSLQLFIHSHPFFIHQFSVALSIGVLDLNSIFVRMLFYAQLEFKNKGIHLSLRTFSRYFFALYWLLFLICTLASKWLKA